MRALRRAHRDDHASRRDWHLYPRIYASTINQMEARLIWSEAERKHNWRKHGLDFAHARWVLDSQYRLDVEVERGGELRIQSFSYVLDVLAVLTVVHTGREGMARIISFRRASADEREVYHEWLESE